MLPYSRTLHFKNDNIQNRFTPLKHTDFLLKESCTTVFIAALFTIARTWKQPKCPSTDEWIKKMWHIYTMEYY